MIPASTPRQFDQELEFLEGGGSAGALLRTLDWNDSPLGLPATWPQSLRSVVGLLLQSRFPMFVAWGPELRFLYNDSYAEILGAKHPRAMGRRFHDIWSEIWPDISPLIDAAMVGQATWREDLPLLMNRKGYSEQTWFTFSYSPVRDESGKVAGMFCACTETTDRVRAQRDSRESERRLSALVAASSYALYRMSADWSKMYVLQGHGFVADTPTETDAWLGSYVHPDDQAGVTAGIQAAIASKSAFELEHRVRRIDGTLGWTLSRAVPLLDARGEIIEWFGAASDVTARKHAEEGLRELNETLERRVKEALSERHVLADVVERTNASVHVLDLSYRWLAVNRAAEEEFERLFGARPQVGVCMLDLLDSKPDHQASLSALWARALEGEEFTCVEEFVDLQGTWRACEMRFNRLLDNDGNRIGAYQFVYDVTDRLHDQERLRQAEEALRHAQKLESIGQLTGGVAHDFNNLLAVFANGLQLLERNVGPEQRQRVFDGMRRAIARGTGLTHHLLAFSRRRPVNPETIDLATQLKSMREILDRSLRGDIAVDMQLQTGLWPVEVDTGELELSILNLCLNARDAMESGGVITIRADNFHAAAGAEQPGDFVRLAVADTGCGMPREILARVMEPFFTTKDVGKGSGLGLPQVYGFAQQSRGHLQIDSTVGAGTVVTLVLPRSLSTPVTRDAEAEDANRLATSVRGGVVLLVEDDNEVSALTREMLGCLGFSVIHVANPGGAFYVLAEPRTVDVILSDIMMPGGMSGLEFAREVRRRYPHLPVVLTTGYAEAAASMKPSEFQLLLKPYSTAALAEALNVEALDSRALP